MQPLSDTLTLVHWVGAVFLATMIVTFSAVAGRIRDGLRGASLLLATFGVVYLLYVTIGVPPYWALMLFVVVLGTTMAWFVRRHGLLDREYLARYFSLGPGRDAS